MNMPNQSLRPTTNWSARVIGGWTLTALLGSLFLASGVAKFVMPPAQEAFEKMGLEDKRILIACGELISAVLFLFPRTFSLGVLLLSGYMGGAIVVHMTKNESYLPQSIILLLIWLTAYLRHPEMFASFWTLSSSSK
jgi:uncharacterized membrane protein YphA (DoxX/SURF4 family)